jgi:hypothetical protein
LNFPCRILKGLEMDVSGNGEKMVGEYMINGLEGDGPEEA